MHCKVSLIEKGNLIFRSVLNILVQYFVGILSLSKPYNFPALMSQRHYKLSWLILGLPVVILILVLKAA